MSWKTPIACFRFPILTLPATDMVFGSANGSMIRDTVSGKTALSASIVTTNSPLAARIPAFTARALPPFLSIEIYRSDILESEFTAFHPARKSRMAKSVPSVDPSFTTIISIGRCLLRSSDRTVDKTPTSSFHAGTMTDTVDRRRRARSAER